jgi:Protein of unknown function (DUF3768)
VTLKLNFSHTSGAAFGSPLSFWAIRPRPANAAPFPDRQKGYVMTSTTESKTDRIRTLNDAFRRTFVGGAVMITAGVEAMPLDQRRSLLQKVRSFEAFREDNDPHAEHDFGAVDEAGERFFFKIDYYDRKTEFGSPDPADPAVTTRVMTVMRADEY